MDVANEFKQVNLIEGNSHVLLIANSGPETLASTLNFPATGKWYDYFSGQSFDVTNKTLPINLVSGEFHLFVNEAWNNKNLNLVPWSVPNFQVLGTANESALSLQVYPNPSHNIVHVSWNAGIQLEIDFKIIDNLGREVLSRKIPQIPNRMNEFEFSKTDLLKAGIYFIQMGNAVRKLVVE
jgi:hypothetical protein